MKIEVKLTKNFKMYYEVKTEYPQNSTAGQLNPSTITRTTISTKKKKKIP
jgi:hypothetical protein